MSGVKETPAKMLLLVLAKTWTKSLITAESYPNCFPNVSLGVPNASHKGTIHFMSFRIISDVLHVMEPTANML
jgi:hypothetical protein